MHRSHQPVRLASRRSTRSLLAATLAVLAGATAASEAPGALQPAPGGLDALVRAHLPEEAAAGVRVEVRVGAPDPRLNLAACRRAEPYLLPGIRLWGRASIGMRCIDGANWATTLPVQVDVFGPALVPRRPLAAGSVPDPQDFDRIERELTREPAPLVADASALAGRVLARAVPAGQPLRADALRIPTTVSPGDPVRIRITGDGFVIGADAVAIGAAGEGQVLRARTESGRVVAGPLRGRVIDLRL